MVLTVVSLIIAAQDRDGVTLGAGREMGGDALRVGDGEVPGNLRRVRLVDVKRVEVQPNLADVSVKGADLNQDVTRGEKKYRRA